ncbi:Mth938-like domain-containing protein [Streptomyces sp. NPDC090077]|uniref:Mth938-like domain-containing protein n=1 Tax=Streptomyces sp. NPDC090077 TaxID=3365938 RepID=UPI00382DA325
MERSPLITRISWGEMEVEGLPSGKDFVLYPGGGSVWDWGVYGTRHEPGIRDGEVRELLGRGCAVVVLSQGMERRLKATPEALEVLREAGVDVYVDETRGAVEVYNRLAGAGEAVGGLFHSTC